MSKNKYHNKRMTTSDGIRHDSIKEGRRWNELKILERAGEIRDLKRQVKFVLIPAQYESYQRISKHGKPLKDGRKLIERELSYIADFVYVNVETGETVVEDTKGVRTKEYVIKRKLMLWIHKVKITEI